MSRDLDSLRFSSVADRALLYLDGFVKDYRSAPLIAEAASTSECGESSSSKAATLISPPPTMSIVEQVSEPVQPTTKTPSLGRSCVSLRVGERLFWTRRSTLEKSPFFAALLSGRWATPQANKDGAIFVDADPDVFEDVLAYLRLGNYPLFWDRGKGFDHARYMKLGYAARYFGLDALEVWISDQHYLNAIDVTYNICVFEEWPSDSRDQVPASVERTYISTWAKKPEYRCPRGIPIHDGSPERCGKACSKAMVDGESNYDNVNVMRMLVFDKKTTFNARVCQGDTADDKDFD